MNMPVCKALAQVINQFALRHLFCEMHVLLNLEFHLLYFKRQNS